MACCVGIILSIADAININPAKPLNAQPSIFFVFALIVLLFLMFVDYRAIPPSMKNSAPVMNDDELLSAK